MSAGRSARRSSERGYAMAALLVALGAMAVFAAVAMPVWRTVVQREKEEELVFRGEQYVRAIRLFQRKFANAYPPTVDLLVEQKFLRKKYKDPMLEDGEFVIIYQNMLQPALGGRGGQINPGATGRGTVTGRAGQATTTSPNQAAQAAPAINLQATGPRGGVAGVVSKSGAKSFRIYNGKEVYNEWTFVQVQSNLPGQGGSATPFGTGAGPGGRGTMQPGGGMQQPGGMGGPQRGRGQGGPGGQGPGRGGRGGAGTPDTH
jgi:type II secretory pathway pseudopilin PulG